jgi:catecholate siderophore receptor
MHDFYKNSLHKKSIYLAVVLALQTGMALAEEAIPAAAEELEEVTVKSKKEAPKDGYQATKTRVGKTLQDPHDIPQAVTTVTNQLMHDQQIGSLREALRNVSGLTFNAAEGGRSGDNINLRGFYTFGDTYLDGIRDTAQYNRETFNLEQVDVLRGSAAMLFGRGQAGGVINQVSKMAQLDDKNVVTGSLGEYGYHQFTGDFNHTFDESTAIRVNFMERNEENYRKNPANNDRPELERKGIAASFGMGIGTDNEFFLNHVYTQTRDDPDYGVSFLNGRPIDRTLASGAKIDDSVFYGGNANFDDSDTRITSAIFTHKFTNDIQWRTQVRHADYERAYWTKTPSATLLPTATLGVNGNPTRTSDYMTNTVQTDFTAKVDIAGMKHETLMGYEYLFEDSYRQGLLNLGTTAAPIYNKNSVTGAPTEFTGDSHAFYVQDTIEFIPKWKALLGIRHDTLDAEYSSLTSPQLGFSEESYRAGLSYHPTDTTHYYASYSDAFSPTADLYQLSGGELPPERSDTKEVGAKWLLMDGDLSVRVALYRTEKEWERNTDLESTAALVSRERHTTGLELEMAGKVTDNWEVFGGLALINTTFAAATANGTATGPTGLAGTGYAVNGGVSEVTDAGQPIYRNRSQQTSEGERPRNTPTVTANFWTTYKFLGNWKVGGGFEAKGERAGYGVGTCATATQNTQAGANLGRWTYNNCSTAAFNPNKLPGYVRADAMLAYEAQKWAVRLNVKNLLNKVYYDALYENGGFSVPGNGRTAIVTTEFKF